MEIDPQKLEMMEGLLNDFRKNLAGSLSREVAASELTTKYLTVLSHQLRTPLTVVRFNAEAMLESEDLPEEFKENVTSMHAAAVQAIMVLNDIVLAQDIEKGKLAVTTTEVDFVTLIKDAINQYSSTIDEKKLAVNFNPPEEMTTQADSHKLENIISHLIRNAVYYSNEEGSVDIELTESKIEVKDNGIGISKKDQEFIFDRFYRGENASKMFTDSSGLGLYIIKHLTKTIGAKIEFESEEGKGSKFTLTLPVNES